MIATDKQLPRLMLRNYKTYAEIFQMAKGDFQEFQDYMPELQLRLDMGEIVEFDDLDKEENCSQGACEAF